MESKLAMSNIKSDGMVPESWSKNANEERQPGNQKSKSMYPSFASESPSIQLTKRDNDERLEIGSSQLIPINKSHGLVTLRNGPHDSFGETSSLTFSLSEDKDGDSSVKSLPFTTKSDDVKANNSLTTTNKSDSLPGHIDAYVINWKPVDVTALPHANNTTSRLFIEQNLRYHNVLRAKHASPPLQIDEKMCRAAQAWVNQMAQEGKLQLSGYGLGENSYWSSEPLVNGNIPVLSWYREGENFNWAVIDHQKGTGHYTQIIWKATQRLGVAVSTSQAGTFVVAFYDPPGNFISQYSDNLTMPL